MSSKYRRFISFVSGLLVMGVALAANTIPAQAASLKIVVDDNLACPRAQFSDIQDAINFAGSHPATITVCAGTYRGEFRINNAKSLTLIAKKGAVITPSFAASPVFDGQVIAVQDSTNVTIKGFTFDGLGRLATFGSPAAVMFTDSTGVIQSNSIINWHRLNFAPPDTVGGNPAGAITGIFVMGGLVHPGMVGVKIDHNTITTFQEDGILVTGTVKLSITNNTTVAALDPSADANNSTRAIVIQPLQATATSGPSGKVTGNKVTGHAFPLVAGVGIDTGILVKQAGNLTITGNKLNSLVFGVDFFNACTFATTSNNNVVKSNTINDTINGIVVTAIGSATCAPHVDNYQIVSNKITDTLGSGFDGIQFDIRGTGGAAAALNEVVKNNTIKNFVAGVDALPQAGGTITGVFTPNKFTPAVE